ncbi:MAG TPA: TolC family protein [Gemmataceae bacterium]|nr:TolC family protein [Gemmataceae bacterium]
MTTRSMLRWAAVGLLSGASAFALGCQTDALPQPDTPLLSPSALTPGLRPTAPPPVGGPARVASAVELPAAAEDTIDLEVALRLAGVDNPTINLAREQVREALAGQLAARALLLPSVNVGGNFYLHRGTLQASSGLMRSVDRQGLYLGFGSRAVGSGTVAFPGVWLFAHLGDAVYDPLAARQRVAASRSEAQAVQNAVLLDVASVYLELAGAEARLDILRRGETELAEVVRLTAAHAKAGQGRQSDANRAAANAELLRREVRRAEEEVAVASARLCRLLNLDPSVRLRSPGGPVRPVRLIPEDTDPESLVALAVRSRPEVFARSAEVLEAQTRARQEQVRPWVPLVSVGYSGGLFGGGSNLVTSDFGPLAGRSDFDVLAVWNVQNLGLGNRALVRRADAGVGQAVAGYDLAVNQVRREVAEALADAQAAARQIEVAGVALSAAEEGFKLEMQRISDPALGRPIETLDSFRQLFDARQELVRAVVAFDVAQFRLFVAVGSNPSRVGGRAH